MAQLMQIIRNLSRNINQVLDTLSQPNRKYIQDQIEYEITHMRCKALLATHILLVGVFILDMIINGFSATTSLVRCVLSIILSYSLILSCQYHPIIFKLFYNIFCLCYGIFIMNTAEKGIHRAWFLALLFPVYLYVFFGDWKIFMLQMAIQVTYVNKVYVVIMERTIAYMTPYDFNKALTYSTNLAFVFCMILITVMHHFMQHTYKKIQFVEKRKDEVENQKIFLLGFSHELRNLINSLTGNVKLASLEVMNSKTKELLRNAEVCGELLLHLVNNILDTGKVEVNELEINCVSTRIYETMEKIWAICSELIKRKNLQGKIRISKEIPKNLMIDHYRLTQVFLNLIGNSIKFTETGSIDISVDWLSQNEVVDEECFQPYPFNDNDDYDEGLFEKQRALFTFANNSFVLGLSSHKINLNIVKPAFSIKNKGVLKIIVSDTGCGMSEEEVRKLFQKFTQVTSDSSKRKLGTGLGLFITKEICQKMKGDIKAFSRKGSGSSFIFCIPADVVQDENDLYYQDIDSLKKFLKTLKLKAMIVDDAPLNCSVLKNFFDKLEIDVVAIANNGLQAFHKYSESIETGEPPQIITMDIEMPTMNGKEAAKKIRKLETEKGIKPCFMPVISANCSESEIHECISKNGSIRADQFIKKPATLEELLRAIGHHFASLQTQKSINTSA